MLEHIRDQCAIQVSNQMQDRPRRPTPDVSSLRTHNNLVNHRELLTFIVENHESHECQQFLDNQVHICGLNRYSCYLNALLLFHDLSYSYERTIHECIKTYIRSTIPPTTAPFAYLEFLTMLRFQESTHFVTSTTLDVPRPIVPLLPQPTQRPETHVDYVSPTPSPTPVLPPSVITD